jgi:hypothetical protein
MVGIEIIMPVIAGGVRNIVGWLENSLKDGKISTYEWGELCATVLQVGMLTMSAFYGLNLTLQEASGVGILASFLISGIKKAGTD